jgi:GntR family transcriptional regulator
MKTAINRESPIPYYVQVKEALRECIERGEWRPEDQLPSETELCEMFDVSRIVIRQALREMSYEGLVLRRKGKGTFVARPRIMGGLVQELTGFHQDMTRRGHQVLTRVLKQAVVPATSEVAGHLQIPPGVQVVQLDRLRFVDGEPMVLVTTYLPRQLVPGLESEDLSTRSLYEYLEQRLGLVIARGHRTIGAVAAGELEAQLLGIEKGAPLLSLHSVSYLDDGTPLEYYYALHRGDRSSFEVELIRRREPLWGPAASGSSETGISLRQPDPDSS